MIPLVAVGSTHVGWVVTTSTQSTEAGVRIRPWGAAVTEELICEEGQTESALPVMAGKPQGLSPRLPVTQANSWLFGNIIKGLGRWLSQQGAYHASKRT